MKGKQEQYVIIMMHTINTWSMLFLWILWSNSFWKLHKHNYLQIIERHPLANDSIVTILTVICDKTQIYKQLCYKLTLTPLFSLYLFKFTDCEREDPSQCYKNGDEVLASYGFNRDNIYIDYFGLIVYAVIWHTLGFFFLIRRLKAMAAY